MSTTNHLALLSHAGLLPERMIFLAHAGSMVHGTHVPRTDPDSIDDIDFIGSFVAPIEHYVGFGRSEGGQTMREAFVASHAASDDMPAAQKIMLDVSTFEIRKIVSLLLKGNPNVLTALWTPPEHVLLSHPIWEILESERALFSTKSVYNSFIGYAHGQMHRMTHFDGPSRRKMREIEEELTRRRIPLDARPEQQFDGFDSANGRSDPFAGHSNAELLKTYREFCNKFTSGYMGAKRRALVERFGYDTKNAAHLIRLLRMGIEFLHSGKLVVDRRRAGDARELIAIKRGEWPFDRVMRESSDLFAIAHEAHAVSLLPSAPDRDHAERLVMRMVLTAYNLLPSLETSQKVT